MGKVPSNLVGRWNYAVKWTQEPGQGARDKSGNEVLMEPLVLPFFIQVDPCPLTSFEAKVASDEFSYTVGGEVIRT